MFEQIHFTNGKFTVKMKLENLQIRVANAADSDKILEFILEHFYRDEPLLSIAPKKESRAGELEAILHSIQNGLTIVATHKPTAAEETEQLLGINVAHVKTPNSVQEYFDEAKNVGLQTHYGKELMLLGKALEKSNVFQRYAVDKVLYSTMSCVIPAARGNNLGCRLKQALMDLAKRQGFKVILVDCSSKFSAAVVERLDWELIGTILYKDYLDADGKRVFDMSSSPHEGLKTFAVRL